MAYRCTIGSHTSCSACGKFVSPNLSDHAHIYRGRGRQSDVICDTCWLSTAIAATHLLSAVDAAGIQLGSCEILQAFLQRHVIIGIDVPLQFGPEAAN